MEKVQILMYHRVGNFPGRVKKHGALYCHLPRFQAQMEMFKQLGYNIITLNHAVAGLKQESELPKKSMVLTFDDAYVDFLEHAAPVLLKFGYPATVYAVSSRVGGHSEWVAKDQLEPAPLMTAGQLREIERLGFTVGSHTKSHPRLAEQSSTVVRREVGDSKIELEDLLGKSVEHFCYPYGSHNSSVAQIVEESGYSSATTCVRAVATPEFSSFTLPRKAVSRGDSLLGVWWKIAAKNKPKQT